MTRLDPEVAWYYEKGRESARLTSMCQLEEARTRQIILTRLESRRLSVVDIGGGPGAYSVWLAELGHDVDLVDPIALHVEQAKAATTNTGVRLNGIHLADAERLPFADESFDLCLMLGPLYHLTTRSNRLKALREAYRVLRPGARLFAAAISRYAATVDGFFKDLIQKPDFVSIMKQALRDGQHRNPERQDGLFTTSYFHTADDLREELKDSGFTSIELLPIEGPWACIPEFDRKWQDERFRSLLLDAIERMETDNSVVGFGGHIMGIASRPQRSD
jgi:ubiquinone/menaquinone biosynthesis C-methylase UbiE